MSLLGLALNFVIYFHVSHFYIPECNVFICIFENYAFIHVRGLNMRPHTKKIFSANVIIFKSFSLDIVILVAINQFIITVIYMIFQYIFLRILSLIWITVFVAMEIEAIGGVDA